MLPFINMASRKSTLVRSAHAFDERTLSLSQHRVEFCLFYPEIVASFDARYRFHEKSTTMTGFRRPNFSASPSSAQSSVRQLAIWGLSAALIALLLPMLAVFWIWSAVTGYATAESDTRGAGRLTRDLGRSRFVRLKVRDPL